ncbi:MAG: nitroreductase family deazaflavin-dependent oxidoreductase [Actinomycetota bacterium]|nr:nitroreductase family deazaflavin-dependent oxidoreductase [Actinomycetota bacterium]
MTTTPAGTPATPEPDDDYAPSPAEWVRRQVAAIEAAGDTNAVDLNGLPVMLLTMRGAKSGKVRKVPLMRVEHDGVYLAVASQGGAPSHPQWYRNLTADPDIVVQDGTQKHDVRARELEGAEREQWWERAVAAFAPYAEYQQKTTRTIPVLVLEPR